MVAVAAAAAVAVAVGSPAATAGDSGSDRLLCNSTAELKIAPAWSGPGSTRAHSSLQYALCREGGGSTAGLRFVFGLRAARGGPPRPTDGRGAALAEPPAGCPPAGDQTLMSADDI